MCRAARHAAYGFEPSEVHGEIGAVIAMAAGEKVKRLGPVHVNRKVRREANRLTAAVGEGGGRVLLPAPGSRFTV